MGVKPRPFLVGSPKPRPSIGGSPKARPRPSIVGVWLKFLDMPRYTRHFLDNGYDDLETIKRMGEVCI